MPTSARALHHHLLRLAASMPNRGAVKGFKDRTVLEYSMHLDQDGVHPDPDLEVPNCYHGLISALATHQTLLGDAIATRDPKLFADTCVGLCSGRLSTVIAACQRNA